MKKFIALLLSGVLLTGAMGSVPVSAEETDGIGKNLIVHYDFEGETLVEQLSDKASGGSSKENLTLATTQGTDGKDLTYIKDGVAHIDTTGENYLLSDFTEDTAMGTDLQGLTEYTVFAEFTANGKGTQWADVFHVDNLARTFVTSSSDGRYDLRVRLGENCNGSNRLDSQAIGQTFFCEDGSGEGDVVCLAITVAFDADAKTVTVKIYSSYDNGKTYKLKEKTWNNIESLYSTACGKLVLGKLFDARNADRGYSFDIRDFRIYNTELTEAQIQSITGVDVGGEQPDDPNLPDDPVNPDDPSNPDDPANPDNPDNPNDPTATDTHAPANTDTQEPAGTQDTVNPPKAGCASSVGTASILAIVGIASLAGFAVRKKKED